MIVMILCTVLGAILVARCFFTMSDTVGGKIGSIIGGGFMGSLAGAVVGLLITIGLNLCFAGSPTERVFVSEKPIYSVVDNQGINGSFALGYGTVKDELKYYYIVRDDLGENVQSVSASNTYIQTTQEQPKITTYIQVFKDDFLNCLMFPIVYKNLDTYIIQVPDNTIKYSYEIDLK